MPTPTSSVSEAVFEKAEIVDGVQLYARRATQTVILPISILEQKVASAQRNLDNAKRELKAAQDLGEYGNEDFKRATGSTDDPINDYWHTTSIDGETTDTELRWEILGRDVTYDATTDAFPIVWSSVMDSSFWLYFPDAIDAGVPSGATITSVAFFILGIMEDPGFAETVYVHSEGIPGGIIYGAVLFASSMEWSENLWEDQTILADDFVNNSLEFYCGENYDNLTVGMYIAYLVLTYTEASTGYTGQVIMIS